MHWTRKENNYIKIFNKIVSIKTYETYAVELIYYVFSYLMYYSIIKHIFIYLQESWKIQLRIFLAALWVQCYLPWYVTFWCPFSQQPLALVFSCKTTSYSCYQSTSGLHSSLLGSLLPLCQQAWVTLLVLAVFWRHLPKTMYMVSSYC